MAQSVLGGAGSRVEEGGLSRALDVAGNWFQAAPALRGQNILVLSSSERHPYRETEVDIFREEVRRTLAQRASDLPDKWVRPASRSGNSLTWQGGSSGLNELGQHMFAIPATHKDTWQYWLQGTYSAESQKLDRRIRRFVSFAGTTRRQERLTGPMQFMKNLLTTWNLNPDDAVALLGLEQSDRTYVRGLLSGRAVLTGRDVKDRIACLLHIRMTLFSLFRDENVENQWLREQHPMLEGQTPMDLMLDGGIENLWLVREYVDTAACR